jgi:hypothetical protein
MITSENNILRRLRNYFLYNSSLMKDVLQILDSRYDICRLIDNDMEAVRARIEFVQRNEVRTGYYPIEEL